MVRQIFKNLVIAAAGPLPGQLTIEHLKRWTTLRKGVFVDKIDESVTHLLCTEEQYRRRGKIPRARKALQVVKGRGKYVVHHDWFEVSAGCNRKLPEAEYSMRQKEAQERARQRDLRRIEKGRRNGEKFVNTNLYHIYQDREFFAYEIDLTREDGQYGALGQRHTLCLWESNAWPHLYWFTAKFLPKKGGRPSYHRDSPCSGKWRHEFDLFTKYFETKTGVPWEDRVSFQGTKPGDKFQYTPPGGGKPVGRRLRHSLDYCLEINATLRGLPAPSAETKLPTPPLTDGSDNGDDDERAPGDIDMLSEVMKHHRVDEGSDGGFADEVVEDGDIEMPDL